MRGATPRGFPGRSTDCQRSGGGFALVLVLLLLTLLIVVVYSFVYSTRVNLRLARNRVADLQMTQLVKAGLEAAKSILNSDKTGHDWLGDSWAKPVPPVTVQGAILRVLITDEERKLNLNSLVVPRGKPPPSAEQISLARELAAARIRSAVTALNLAFDEDRFMSELIKWVGAKTETDVRQKKAASNFHFIGRHFHSMDQLLEFEPVSPAILYSERDPDAPRPGLVEVLTVLSSGKVNVNTAPQEVLLALSEKMTRDMADEIIRHREEVEGLKDLSSLKDIPGLAEGVITEIEPQMTTRSTVFLLKVQVERGQMRRVMQAFLQRPIAVVPAPMPGLIEGLGDIRLLRWEELRR